MRQAGASTPPDAAERTAIVRICRVTEGLPLALLLAARWTPILSTVTIAQELETDLALLDTPRYRMSERQHSMRVVLRSTWTRLSEAERTALQRLAVLQPNFSREAAQAVAEVDLSTLSLLVEGSLLGRDPAVERYAMHELVRQYAAEQLAGHPEEEGKTRARHVTFYAALVRQLAPALRQTVTAQETMSADIANIRAAWDWAAERAEVDILEQLLAGFAKWHEFQGLRGQAAEALGRAAERLRAVLAQGAMPEPALQRLLGFVLVEAANAFVWLAAYPRAHQLLEEAFEVGQVTTLPHLQGRVAYCFGWLFGRQRDLENAVQWLQRALALAQVAKDPALEADVLRLRGAGAFYAAQYAEAHHYLARALALHRTTHDPLGEAELSYFLGLVAHARGDFGEAQRRFEEALQGLRGLAWRQGENVMLHALGLVYDEAWGQHVKAEDCFTQDLRMARQIGDRMREAFALAALGRNALYQGDLERAGTLLDMALSLSQQVTSRESTALVLRGQSLLAHYQGDDLHARRCAEEALAVAHTAGLRREERLALRLLGHALLGLGQVPAAGQAYQQAADLGELLGLQHLHGETATDLARVALAQGDVVQAAALVGAAVVPDLEKATVAGLEEPALTYLTCYQVLWVAGDARADAVLAAGHAFLEARAAQFVASECRSRFLHGLPAHRELLAARRARRG
jgi:tetratricopeptide (TPR) repeat protein